MKDGKILIAGAGLGGLTAAACLLKAGFDVEIYEQAPQLGEVGAGIQISANAGRVMRHIGVLDKLIAAGVTPEEYRFRTFHEGDVLQTIPLGTGYVAKHGVPYVTIHRADLHAILVDAVRALKPDAIHVDSAVTGLAEDGDGITLDVAKRGRIKADALIGADGIKSVIRPLIVGPTEAVYSGDVVWRVTVPMEDMPPEMRTERTEIWVGPGRHAVTYALRKGTLLNFVGCVEYNKLEEESWVTPRPWVEMHQDFQGWHPFITTIIERAPRNECYRWALKIRKPITNWSSKRATLLGDSAHPTLPYMAQGAAMAMEDGAVVARAFQQAGSVPEAISLYQRNRIERTTRIVNESSANRELFHLPRIEDIRNSFAKRDMNAERTAWLFSYDPTAVPLT
jgi:salicylate hydroxylase